MLSSNLPVSVNEKQWIAFEIDDNQSYQRYEAVPLISCSAYLFRYITKDNRHMAIFYHAKSGLPKELGEITEKIKSDGIALKNVSLFIASSEEASNPKHRVAIEIAANSRSELFKRYGFPAGFLEDKSKCIIEEKGYSCYCVDTQGNHGVSIVKKHKQNVRDVDNHYTLLEDKPPKTKLGLFTSKNKSGTDNSSSLKNCCTALRRMFSCK